MLAQSDVVDYFGWTVYTILRIATTVRGHNLLYAAAKSARLLMAAMRGPGLQPEACGANERLRT